eukprot:3567169-Amphidinium_carterae.1
MPALMVIKNMPAAGTNPTSLLNSKPSTSNMPSEPAPQCCDAMGQSLLVGTLTTYSSYSAQARPTLARCRVSGF